MPLYLSFRLAEIPYFSQKTCPMNYFTPAYLDFFKELSVNNHKAWFDEHRSRYENDVKKPFNRFIQDFIFRIHLVDPKVQIEPKDAIVRINRDIRFSKDKAPYKLHMGAIISPLGKRDKMYPGIYIELAADAIRFFGGCYFLDTKMLHAVRSLMAESPHEFREAYTEPSFVELFGTLQGEKNKRIPPEFAEAFRTEPLIAGKQFYFGTELENSLITHENLLDELMNYYHASRKINAFLEKAFESV